MTPLSSPPVRQWQPAQSPWKWLLCHGPLGSASAFPLLTADPFEGLETQSTAVREDLSKENSTVHSQEEAHGRCCN